MNQDNGFSSAAAEETEADMNPSTTRQSFLTASPGIWLAYVRHMLIAGRYTAETIRNGKNVLVYCQNGTEFTPGVISLAQLFLDGYYRTVSGFSMLVSKEFVAFGHQFGSGYGNFAYPEKEQCFGFPLFLEAVL